MSQDRPVDGRDPPPGSGLLVVAAALITLFFALTLRDGQSWGGDFSHYILHARNLARGQPYAESCFVAEPFGHLISPLVYPPLLPLILTPSWRLFGLNLTALKLTILPFSFLLLVVYGRLLRSGLGPATALGGLLVFGLNPEIWRFKDRILADIPFLLLVYVALAAVSRTVPAETWRKALRDSLGPAALTLLACAARSAALVLLPCLLLHELRGRLRVPKMTLVTSALVAAGIGLQGLVLRSPLAGYGRHLASSRTSPLENLYDYLKDAVRPWENGQSFDLALVLFALLSLLALAGFVARVASGPGPYEWFGLLYGLMILWWPAHQGLRFLLPLLPLYVFYSLLGLQLVRRLVPRRAFAALTTIMVLSIGLSYVGRYASLNWRAMPDGVARPEARELFSFARGLPAAGTLIVFRRPRVLCLYTGRRTTYFPCEREQHTFMEFITGQGVTHVVLDNEVDHCLDSLLAERPVSFGRVFENSRFAVFEVLASRPEPGPVLQGSGTSARSQVDGCPA